MQLGIVHVTPIAHDASTVVVRVGWRSGRVLDTDENTSPRSGDHNDAYTDSPDVVLPPSFIPTAMSSLTDRVLEVGYNLLDKVGLAAYDCPMLAFTASAIRASSQTLSSGPSLEHYAANGCAK